MPRRKNNRKMSEAELMTREENQKLFADWEEAIAHKGVVPIVLICSDMKAAIEDQDVTFFTTCPDLGTVVGVLRWALDSVEGSELRPLKTEDYLLKREQ